MGQREQKAGGFRRPVHQIEPQEAQAKVENDDAELAADVAFAQQQLDFRNGTGESRQITLGTKDANTE